MAVSEQLKALVDQMPDADGGGMFTENIDKNKVDKAIAMIHEGGRDHVEGLVEMLDKPGSEKNVKPHYALHCLANHVLIVRDESGRRQLAETLAPKLDGDLPVETKNFLCQILQWAGRREAVEALGKLLLDETTVEAASMALTAIRDGAAAQFRAALPQATGKCRLHVVQGLGAVEDLPSADALRQALSDPDREVRLAAGWGLSRMSDAGSVDALLTSADVSPGWERIQATKHCMVLAEKLSASGKADAAARIYQHLGDTRTSAAEQYIRDAASKALSAL